MEPETFEILTPMNYAPIRRDEESPPRSEMSTPEHLNWEREKFMLEFELKNKLEQEKMRLEERHREKTN